MQISIEWFRLFYYTKTMNKKTIANLTDYVKRTSWLKIVLVFIISFSSTVASAKKFEFSMKSKLKNGVWINSKVVVDTDASTIEYEYFSFERDVPFQSLRYKYFKRYGKDNGANMDILVFSENPLPPTFSEFSGQHVIFAEKQLSEESSTIELSEDAVLCYHYRPVSMTEYSRIFAALRSHMQQRRGNSSGSSSASSNSGSGSSIESIELPLKFEVPDGLNMKTDDANKGEYSGLATHEGGVVGIILHTKTGKYPADAGLDDYEVEIAPMNGQTANWISEYGKQANVYAIKIEPNRTNRSRAANLYFKIGGKVQGRLFVLQLAEGSKINW